MFSIGSRHIRKDPYGRVNAVFGMELPPDSLDEVDVAPCYHRLLAFRANEIEWSSRVVKIAVGVRFEAVTF